MKVSSYYYKIRVELYIEEYKNKVCFEVEVWKKDLTECENLE